MNLDSARIIASNLIRSMQPHCARIATAGSVRRRCPEVRDLEIVAIPIWGERPAAQLDLFSGADTEPANRLFDEWTPPYPHTWTKGHKPEGRYWQAQLQTPSGPLQLDLFLTSPERWGIIYVIRTGPRDFSKALMIHAKSIGMRVDEGNLWDHAGCAIPTPEEANVFAELGLEYVEPQHRIDASSLRGLTRRAA